MPQPAGERSLSRARPRDTAPWARVPPDERAYLRAGVGSRLEAARRAAGLSRLALARRVGCSAGLVRHLERGTCRPREAAVRWLAYALEPDDPAPLREALLQAAGDSLRPDTSGTARAWTRRCEHAFLAGHWPVPSDVAQAIAAHQAAAAANREALAILDRPGAMRSVRALDQASALLDRALVLAEQAGPPVTVIVGRHRRTYHGI
ncbi:helix-turn-helix domain-containing protein [Frankia sp. EAN1pec]|uniref:helix-turn-helix domain-containing protein n=1 Tax=Parafrankia sp. (strain EAN1pec) TaxID=298653 RepID=UPI0018DEB950